MIAGGKISCCLGKAHIAHVKLFCYDEPAGGEKLQQ